jgi:hypothetical protein
MLMQGRGYEMQGGLRTCKQRQRRPGTKKRKKRREKKEKGNFGLVLARWNEVQSRQGEVLSLIHGG